MIAGRDAAAAMTTNVALHKHPFRVLVIKPSSLGDIIHAFPAVDLLLSRYPDAEIDWLVHPAFAETLAYCRNINRIIIFPRKELGKAKSFLPHFMRLSHELRHRRYDLAIDFQGLMRSALFGRIAKAKRFVGFAHPKEPLSKMFYREKITIADENRHAVEKNLAIVARLLNIDIPREFAPASLPLNPAVAEKARMMLAQNGAKPNGRLLGIIPGARWETKRWPEKFFAEVIDSLDERIPDLQFVLLGAAAECQAADNIAKLVHHPYRLLPLAGKTGIAELTEVIRQTEGLLTNDSGPMHIAAALQIPVFAMFGPTVPEKTGPWGRIHTIFQPGIECCGCLKRQCPRGDSQCRELIEPINVANAIFTTIQGEKTCSDHQ